MNSTESIKIIFDQIIKTVGKKKAPLALSATLTSIIYDLEEEGHFTPDNFEKALEEEAKFCLKCSQKVA
jgi:hypothetical protein